MPVIFFHIFFILQYLQDMDNMGFVVDENLVEIGKVVNNGTNTKAMYTSASKYQIQQNNNITSDVPVYG